MMSISPWSIITPAGIALGAILGKIRFKKIKNKVQEGLLSIESDDSICFHFPSSSVTLTQKQYDELKKAVKRFKEGSEEGKEVKAHIAAWCDRAYPNHRKDERLPFERKIAEKRLTMMKKLLSELGVNCAASYNMSCFQSQYQAYLTEEEKGQSEDRQDKQEAHGVFSRMKKYGGPQRGVVYFS